MENEWSPRRAKERNVTPRNPLKLNAAWLVSVFFGGLRV